MRCPPFGIAVALLLVATVVSAAPPARRKGARLVWARGALAERCVGQLGLEEDVKSRLGYDSLALPPELAIEGVVVRAGTGFRAELVVRDADGKLLGTRQLTSPDADCRALGDAVAVAITVAIDPEVGGTRTAQVEEQPGPLAVAPPVPCPVPAPAPAPPRGHVALMAGASAGLVPDVSLVTSLRAHLAMGPAWEVGASASFWPESRTAGLGFALTTAELEGCMAPLASARVVRWCAGAHVGLFQVFVHAPELAPVEVGMFPWAAVEAGPSLSFPLVGPLRLEAGATAIFPLLRRQAFLRGESTPVWEESGVGGRAELGVGAAF